jgi:hypothetical protein
MQQLRDRNNQHRSKVRMNMAEYDSSRVYLYPHFKGKCQLKHFQLSILERVSNEDEKLLEQREEYWIKELRTVFPYGLNARISLTEGEDKASSIEKLFNPIIRKRTKRGRGSNRVHTIIDPAAFFKKWFNIAKLAKSNPRWRHNLRVSINSMRKSNMRRLCQWTHFNGGDFAGIKKIAYNLLSDLLDTRMFKADKPKEKRDPPKLIWKIPFKNYGINYLGIERLLHSKELKKMLPEHLKFDDPMVVYTYEQPIRNKIFNYKKVIESLKGDSWSTYKQLDGRCGCGQTRYCNQDLGHIISGDLTMVKNKKLKKLLRFGPNFRERRKLDWNVVRECFKDTATLITDWARLSELNEDSFKLWKKKLESLIEARITKLTNRRWPTADDLNLNDGRLRDDLRNLHQKYVIIPADKAANNVIIVCKQFYLHCCVSELTNAEQGTYVEQGGTMPAIVKRVNDIMEKFKANETNIKNLKLADIYWTAKMHKTPVGQRFIAASRTCITKKLSSILTHCLKVISKQHRLICKNLKRKHGINFMWIADNSKPLLERIERYNLLGIAKSIDTFDFATLYTNIGHMDLKGAMKEVIMEAFESSENKFISVYAKSAKWVKKPRKGTIAYTAEQLIQMVEILVDNIYVQCGDKIFKQDIGIPMGTDCAPYLANLFLYHYEKKWLLSMVEEEKTDIAKNFNNCFRYIDDLATLNNDLFGEYWQEIYPQQLQLKKENKESHQANFLDLTITVNNGRFMLNLYDKRDDFGFDIVSFPHCSSNIHFRRAHGVIIGQLIRFANGCSHGEQFIARCKKLINQLLVQGYSMRILRQKCTNFSLSYPHLCRKFKFNSNAFVNYCFSTGKR